MCRPCCRLGTLDLDVVEVRVDAERQVAGQRPRRGRPGQQTDVRRGHQRETHRHCRHTDDGVITVTTGTQMTSPDAGHNAKAALFTRIPKGIPWKAQKIVCFVTVTSENSTRKSEIEKAVRGSSRKQMLTIV